MAILYITEINQPANTIAPNAALAAPVIAYQSIAIGGASVPSNSFSPATSLIRVHTDAICAIDIGRVPVAVAAGGASPTTRMAAGQTEYYQVPSGQGFKLAVVSST